MDKKIIMVSLQQKKEIIRQGFLSDLQNGNITIEKPSSIQTFLMGLETFLYVASEESLNKYYEQYKAH